MPQGKGHPGRMDLLGVIHSKARVEVEGDEVAGRSETFAGQDKDFFYGGQFYISTGQSSNIQQQQIQLKEDLHVYKIKNEVYS